MCQYATRSKCLVNKPQDSTYMGFFGNFVLFACSQYEDSSFYEAVTWQIKKWYILAPNQQSTKCSYFVCTSYDDAHNFVL